MNAAPSKKMRVAFVIRNLKFQDVWTATDSSLQAREQIRIFSQLGADVSVIAEDCDRDGLKKFNVQVEQSWLMSLGKKFFGSLFSSQANQACRKGRYDLVFGYGDHETQNILIASTIEQALKAPKKSPPLIIVNSQLLKKNLISKDGLNARQVEVCPPCYDRDKFHAREKIKVSATIRASLGYKTTDLVIGLWSYTSPTNINWNHWLKVLSQIHTTHPLKLLICGPNGISNTLKGPLSEHRLDSHTQVLESPANLHELYHAVDIFIAPNTSEEFGRAALDAMACGLPVLVPQQLAASELIASKQLVKDTSDETGWKEILNELIQNKEWRLSVARQNAERATAFDENQYIKRFLKILSEHGLITHR